MSNFPIDDAHSTVRLPAISSPGICSLLIFSDEGVRRVPLVGDRLTLGSAVGADIVLRDASVSGRHCSLQPASEGAIVRDLQSKNGTYVGAARIEEAIVSTGATLSIGRTSMLVVGGVSEEDSPENEAVPLRSMVGASKAMCRLAARVRRLAQYQSPVLIHGETGVGKELVARALHDEGPRRDKPYVVLNMAALPRELVESELFGHERGAFTGAIGRKTGAFEDAEDGTLFLDEIGDLPLELQPKLLRALDGYAVRRVGGAGGGKRSNVRIIAATHARLDECVERGSFRRDLYHRLEVFTVEVPPLRDREGDIILLARRILLEHQGDLGVRRFNAQATNKLLSYDWPGNVRELRNVVLRAADASKGEIGANDIATGLRMTEGASTKLLLTRGAAEALFNANGRNLSLASRVSGVPRTTLRRILEGKAG